MVLVAGIAVTSLARTVVDLACRLNLERSVGVGDAALRLGLDPAALLVARVRRTLERGRPTL